MPKPLQISTLLLVHPSVLDQAIHSCSRINVSIEHSSWWQIRKLSGTSIDAILLILILFIQVSLLELLHKRGAEWFRDEVVWLANALLVRDPDEVRFFKDLSWGSASQLAHAALRLLGLVGDSLD